MSKVAVPIPAWVAPPTLYTNLIWLETFVYCRYALLFVLPSETDNISYSKSFASAAISAYKTPSVLFTLGLELLQVSAALVIVVPAVLM